MLSKLFLGLRSYRSAIQFLRTHKLWGYLLLPALLNLAIIVGVVAFGIAEVGVLKEWLVSKLGIGTSDQWWSQLADYLLWGVLYVVLALLFIKSYKFLMLIILSPALALLAEKVQDLLLNRENPFEWGRFVSDVLRGIGLTIRNLAIEISLLILLFLLSLIPAFAPFTTVAMVLVECYFIGFSMIDYRNEYLGLSAKESRAIVAKHRPFAIGNGLGMYLMLFVPLVGVLVAPLLAVVAAGLGIAKLEPVNRAEGREENREING